MRKELELWKFIADRLQRGEDVMLLVVAESSGSSPGRPGYKMAIGADGEMIGSIGGGVMEVSLVEESKRLLSAPAAVAGGSWEQVHRKDVENSSGMICSGKQTVVYFRLSGQHEGPVQSIIQSMTLGETVALELTSTTLGVNPTKNPPAAAGGTDFRASESRFRYVEIVGFRNHLYIVGGGHCALALSEVMSKMDFHICLFDDRPHLNTVAKNRYAHEIKIIDSYERIGDHIASGVSAFVVVMTLGYQTDEVVIRSLIDKEFKYFGVLGSKAKMSTMFRSLREDGISNDRLSRISTPIGLPINSRSPEEIAVSIAAEIISVKNG